MRYDAPDVRLEDNLTGNEQLVKEVAAIESFSFSCIIYNNFIIAPSY